MRPKLAVLPTYAAHNGDTQSHVLEGCGSSNNSNQNKRYRSSSTGSVSPWASPGPLTLEAVMKEINMQFTKTFDRIDTISNKIDTVKAELNEQLSSVSRDFNSFKAECADKFKFTDDAMCELESRIDGISQEIGGIENRNERIVSGVPHIPGKMLRRISRICGNKSVFLKIQPLVDVRRLKTGTQGDGLILLQFALRNNRDDFYSCYLRKRDLKLQHLGMNSTRRFYVNENLAVPARKIKKAALELKKSEQLSSVYSKKGIVHVKRTADQQPGTAVHSENQLQQYS
ncbi:hypothetical protein quinque_006901 [Culex quinquefasciatus]